MDNSLKSMYLFDFMDKNTNYLDRLKASVSPHLLCAFRTELGPEWRDTGLTDPFNRIYFIESGAGEVVQRGKTYRLRPGRLYLVPAHTTHDYRCPKRIVIHWTHFTASVWNGMNLFDCFAVPLEVCPSDPGFVVEVFDRLSGAEIESDAAGEWLETQGALMLLMAFFLKGAKGHGPAEDYNRMMRFRPVLDAVASNPGSVPPVPELARSVHLEPSYFSRSFRRCFGVSPIQYILEQKIKHAQILLRRSDRTLDRIGRDLGFTDGFHFSRTFRRFTGSSPSQYRRRFRQESP